MIRRAIAVAAACMAVAGAAVGQNFPSRPITIIVPVTAGSAQDYLARLLAPMLAQKLGQPVIVDNKVGASGIIGAEALAKSAPDGHTLMLGAIAYTTAPALRTSLPYDPFADVAPVGPLAKAPMALGIPARIPAANLSEFVELSRGQPGKLNYGSPGNGSPHHLFMELFKQQAAINVVHVPYKQLGGMVNDVLGGTLDAAFFTVFTAVPLAKAGKLKVLAVAGKERSSFAPEVPTFTESKIGGMHVDVWLGLMAQGKTPPEIIQRLNREVMPMLDQPDVKEALLKQGLVTTPGSPADLAAIIREHYALWAEVVKRAGIKPD